MSDRFTRDVIATSLDAAAIEMFDVLRKTAMSPIIYEVLDVGTGITDANGELVSSGAGIPSFIGVLDKSIKAILTKFKDNIADGDLFVLNDPNHGGVTHLNDVVVAKPVFWQETLVAWAASIAHWGDIGGRTPGSMSTDTKDIVAEGLRLPIVRLIDAGTVNESVFAIIQINSRMPDVVAGDLWAQVSASNRATEQIAALFNRYGRSNVNDAIMEARTVGENRARAGLKNLPKGTFKIEEPQDDGSVWKASICITADKFTVDLREAQAQTEGPYNTSRDGALVACQIFFKTLTDPERFANAGSFAPLEVLTKPNTVFHAGPNAPHAYYFETRLKLVDLLWHCLAQAMPEKLPAGHFASIFGTVIAGYHPDTGRRYTMVEPQMGGWGATQNRPGQNAMFSTSHGDTFNCPVEIAEARYGFEVLYKTLSFAPENNSGEQGGAGVSLAYRLQGDATLSTGYSHATVPVWGHGINSYGGKNQLTINRKSNNEEKHVYASNVELKAGDVVSISTAFGGSSCLN